MQRETDTLRALLAARGGAATLFVPAPALLHPDTVGALDSLPSTARLVLVDPPRRVLEAVRLPVEPAGRRWAAQAVGPDARGLPCPLPELRQLGRVAVGLQRYAVAPGGSAPVRFCFADGLALLPRFPESTVVVGASDPFRNDRIDEWDNRAFATALLGGSGRVVWLDLDGPEPPPVFGNGSSGSPAWSPTPGGSTGNGGPGSGTGDGTGARRPRRRPRRRADDDARPGDSRADRPDPPNPLWSAFPGWLWALLAQLAVAALLAALWRARRLGPPALGAAAGHGPLGGDGARPGPALREGRRPGRGRADAARRRPGPPDAPAAPAADRAADRRGRRGRRPHRRRPPVDRRGAARRRARDRPGPAGPGPRAGPADPRDPPRATAATGRAAADRRLPADAAADPHRAEGDPR